MALALHTEGPRPRRMSRSPEKPQVWVVSVVFHQRPDEVPHVGLLVWRQVGVVAGEHRACVFYVIRQALQVSYRLVSDSALSVNFIHGCRDRPSSGVATAHTPSPR
jgi:hypothetical protein